MRQSLLLAVTGLLAFTFPHRGWARGYGYSHHSGSSYGWSRHSAAGLGRLPRSYSLPNPGEHYTRSYTRRDSVYVPGHYATMPNQTKLDNWSTQGNINPHTGRKGTKSPY